MGGVVRLKRPGKAEVGSLCSEEEQRRAELAAARSKNHPVRWLAFLSPASLHNNRDGIHIYAITNENSLLT